MAIGRSLPNREARTTGCACLLFRPLNLRRRNHRTYLESGVQPCCQKPYGLTPTSSFVTSDQHTQIKTAKALLFARWCSNCYTWDTPTTKSTTHFPFITKQRKPTWMNLILHTASKETSQKNRIPGISQLATSYYYVVLRRGCNTINSLRTSNSY